MNGEMGVAGASWGSVKASNGSHDSINPIRQFEETLFQDVLSNCRDRTDLDFIKLSIGKNAPRLYIAILYSTSYALTTCTLTHTHTHTLKGTQRHYKYIQSFLML